jgi:thiol-disulfide isomerase/thioredoxin
MEPCPSGGESAGGPGPRERPGVRASTPARRAFLQWLPAAVLAGLAPSARAAAGARDPGEVAIGQPLRDAPLIGLNGPSRRLSDYLGRPLIINVWASWCGPCRQEMKSLERLAWQDHPVPFALIGISTDDYPEPPRQLLAQTHATISHFIDDRLLWEHMLGASTLPLTVLVDARGRVVDKVHGEQQWDSPEALARIARAFASSARPPAGR